MRQKSDYERLLERKKKKGILQRYYDGLAARLIPAYIQYTSPEVRRDFINERIKRCTAAIRIFSLAYITFILSITVIITNINSPLHLILYIAFGLMSMGQLEIGHLGMFIMSFALMSVVHPLACVIPMLSSVGMAIACACLNAYESVDTTIPPHKFYADKYNSQWEERTELFGGDKQQVISTAKEAAADEREKTIASADITKQQINEHVDVAKIAAAETAAEFRDIVDSVLERAKDSDTEDEKRAKNARLILYCLIILGVIPVCFWCGGSVLNPYSGLYFMGVAATLVKKPFMHMPYLIICLLYIFVLDLASPLLTVSYTICTVLGVLLMLLNMDITTTRFSGKGRAEDINPRGSWSRTNITPEGFTKFVPNPVDERDAVMLQAHTAASGPAAKGSAYKEAEELRMKMLASDKPRGSAVSLINDEKIPEVLFEGLPTEPPAPAVQPPAPQPEAEKMSAVSIPSSADFEQSLIDFAKNSGGSAGSAELDGEEMGTISISAALESNNVDMTNNDTIKSVPSRGGMGSVNLETAFRDNTYDMTNSPMFRRRGESVFVSTEHKMSASDERNVIFSQNIFSNIHAKDATDGNIFDENIPADSSVMSSSVTLPSDMPAPTGIHGLGAAAKTPSPEAEIIPEAFTPSPQPSENVSAYAESIDELTADFPDVSFDIPETDSDFHDSDIPAKIELPRTDFGAASVDFDTPKADFGAASVDFDTPKADFGAVSVDFDTPKADFGAASVDFDTPKADFGAASVDFDTPKADFGAASVDFDTPRTDFETAKADFDVPKVDFGVSGFGSSSLSSGGSENSGFDTSKILFGGGNNSSDDEKI